MSTHTLNSSAIEAKQPAKLDFKDSIRARFESIERQPELATDLSCFHPGGALAAIHFIAHAHGLHVTRWLRLLSHTKAKVEIDTANHVPAYSNEFISARPLVPAWLRIPMPLRYLLAGLVLRFSKPRTTSSITHAHCASGNGLIAWLSGRPYVLQIYGTEILAAHKFNFVYRWFLKKILQKAQRIGGSTKTISRVLTEQYEIPPERLYDICLSYDTSLFYPLKSPERMQLRRKEELPLNEPIWSVCRRTHPLYRTMEVVQGFLEYCQRGFPGRLVLLCGDQDPVYTQAVRQTIRSHGEGHRITIVERLLQLDEFASWLSLSDFSISVPRTDNFSNAVLESMGCGTIPILSDLESYEDLRKCHAVRWMSSFEPQDFTKMFEETSTAWQTLRHSEREECCRFVQTEYSKERALSDIANFYLGKSSEMNELSREGGLNGRAA